MNNEIMEDEIIEQEDKNVKNKRQEFPDSVRKELMLRANLRCCNPQCRRLLVAVDKKTNELTIIGEGAHIYPAKKNGPRYDQNHSSESFIKSQENGLWLCPTCHELIDKKSNITNYPVTKLLDWKRKSEYEYSDCLENPVLDFKMKFNDDYFRDVELDYDILSDLQKVIFFYCVFNECDFDLIIDTDNENQMSDFIETYTKLKNWWNDTTNANLRKLLNYSLKHIGAYAYYSEAMEEWQSMLDNFISELAGNKKIESISCCDSKVVKISFNLIKTKVFKNNDNRLEKFFECFE